MKKKIISVIVGVAGLTMAYFLASGISHIIYNRPTDNAAAETESTTDSAVQGTEEAKSPMTEDEINEMLAGMKTTETAETETATEEQSEVIPVKFEELQAVNPDVYAWITVPGTDIDYPILQHASDNSYYLMHNIDGYLKWTLYSCLPETIQWINLEEDLNLPGLRTSKLESLPELIPLWKGVPI